MRDIIYLIVKMVTKETDLALKKMARDYTVLALENSPMSPRDTFSLPLEVTKHLPRKEFISILIDKYDHHKRLQSIFDWEDFCEWWNPEINKMWADCDDGLGYPISLPKIR